MAGATHQFYTAISPVISAHLFQPAPKVTWTRTHLNHCFCHNSRQVFRYLHAACLRTTSRACFSYKFLSSCYRKGRSKMWLHSWKGCLLWQSACNTHLQNPTGKASEVSLHWHCMRPNMYSPSPAALAHRTDTVQLTLVTSSISIAWILICGRRPKIAMQHAIISEWAWSRKCIVGRIEFFGHSSS